MQTIPISEWSDYFLLDSVKLAIENGFHLVAGACARELAHRYIKSGPKVAS